jgi:hypothetical protein
MVLSISGRRTPQPLCSLLGSLPRSSPRFSFFFPFLPFYTVGRPFCQVGLKSSPAGNRLHHCHHDIVFRLFSVLLVRVSH